MTFASWEFFVCLLVALVIYHVAPARLRPLLLLILSVGFYLTWSLRYTVLLAVLVLVTWAMALVLERTAGGFKRRVLLWAALGVPLGLLVFFKALGLLDRA